MYKFIPSWLHLPYREDVQFSLIFFALLTSSLFFNIYLVDAYEAPRLFLLMVLMGCCLLFASRYKTFHTGLSKPILITISLFAGWALIATIFSADAYLSMFGYFARRSNTLIFIITWAIFIAFMSKQIGTDRITTLSRLIICSAVLIGVVGVLQSFGIGYYAGFDAPSRPVIPGLGGNQNFSAMYLVSVIPLLAPLFFSAKNNMRRILYAGVGLTLLWSVMVFASRGAIVGLFSALVIGLVLAAIRKLGWKMNIFILSMLIVSMIFAFTSYSTTRIENVDTSLDLKTDLSTVNRIQVWVQAVDLIAKHPVTGLGPANFLIGYKSMGNNAFAGRQQFDDPHNLYLNIATTTGIPGVVLFVAILYFAIRSYMTAFWKTGSVLQWGLLVGLLALLVSASFTPTTIANWVLLGFFIACSQAQLPGRILFTINGLKKVALIIVGIFLIIGAACFITSEFLEGKVENAYKSQDYRSAKRYASYAQVLNPFNVYPKVFNTATRIRLQESPEQVRERIRAIVSISEKSAVNYQYAGTLAAMLYEVSKDQKDIDVAMAYFAKTNELDANYSPVLTSYAYVAYKSGNIDLSEKLLKQAISLTEQKPSYLNYVLLGEIQLERGQKEAMYRSVEKAYLMQPIPLLKIILDKYQNGEFNDTRLPVYFPPIDII